MLLFVFYEEKFFKHIFTFFPVGQDFLHKAVEILGVILVDIVAELVYYNIFNT